MKKTAARKSTSRSSRRRSLLFPRAYDAMRRQGYSKQKAARISNSMAGKGVKSKHRITKRKQR